jgi:hypothetical protein
MRCRCDVKSLSQVATRLWMGCAGNPRGAARMRSVWAKCPLTRHSDTESDTLREGAAVVPAGLRRGGGQHAPRHKLADSDCGLTSASAPTQ